MNVSIGLLAAGLLAAAVPLSAQVIAGQVLEEATDRPVAGAAVTLTAEGEGLLRTQSDDEGRFRLPVPRPGSYALLVERIGYATTTTEEFAIGAGESLDLVVRLGVTAVPLDPLVVVERRSLRSVFEMRKEAGERSGQGRFIGRETLDSAAATPVTTVLSRVPQVALEYDDAGRAAPIMLSHGGCNPALFINGARFRPAPGESIDQMMSPDNLEGIEIYRHAAELPAEYRGSGTCGVIVFWTRAGEPTSGRFWRFLVAGGAVIGMVLLFAID